MKICKECIWARPGTTYAMGGYGDTVWNGAKCTHPDIDLTPAITNPVTGETEPTEYKFCRTARSSTQKCGPEGKLFNPRVAEMPMVRITWWQRMVMKVTGQ